MTLALRGRADRIAAHAAVTLVEVLGSDSTREHEAEGWAEIADALLTRTGGDAELEVALAGRRAEVARTRGDLEGARAQLERVLAVQERTWGADDARVDWRLHTACHVGALPHRCRQRPLEPSV